ncbi:MAG: lysophospholipid acyltransferase family protein [Elusimicrobiota bacterium]
MTRPPLFNRCLYRFAWVSLRTAFTVAWRLKIVGSENIPPGGPVIFASNHVSLADPPVVGCSVPRPIRFMAKQELFEIPVLGWIIRHVNAFPVRRVERDVSAFKTAQRILAAGEAMILFPEGTRQKNGVLGAPKPGVGMLAAKTGSPVVPVYAHNTGRLSRFKPLAVCFGPPLSPREGEDYGDFSRRVMAAIAELKETHIGSGN